MADYYYEYRPQHGRSIVLMIEANHGWAKNDRRRATKQEKNKQEEERMEKVLVAAISPRIG